MDELEAVRNLYWLSFVYTIKMTLKIMNQDYKTSEERFEKLIDISIKSMKTIDTLVDEDKKNKK